MEKINFMRQYPSKTYQSKHRKVLIPFKDRFVKVNVSNGHKRYKKQMSKQQMKVGVIADKIVDRIVSPDLFGFNICEENREAFLLRYFDLCVDEILSFGIFKGGRKEVYKQFKSLVINKYRSRKQCKTNILNHLLEGGADV